MIAHYTRGGATPEWLREMAEMAHDSEPRPDHAEEERDAYADEARAEAHHREERDRCERETGRPR